ncbi:MAG: hypothetical protein R3335_12125 [Anaerolineales bacterium]|nr:hypothetical protein [Anaerolineales bacterium]
MSSVRSHPTTGLEKPFTTSRAVFRRPWVMLFSRLILFCGIQALFALAYYLAGASGPWEKSADWWLMVVILTNIVSVALLIRVFHMEGKSYWDLFHFDRAHLGADLLAILLVTVIAAPVSYLPNVILGKALFGTPEATLDLLVRPLPLWVAYACILLFPVTQGLAELPTYFGYVLPRFKANGMVPWIAIALPSLMLGFQHLALPLLFDIRFIAWRALMYLPFALLVAVVLNWRPRLLPYLVIVHIIMDMSFAAMFLEAAYMP